MGHYKSKGYPFKTPLQKIDPQSKAPVLRGPMLAGKCLDQFTATDGFMTLPQRKENIWEKACTTAGIRTTNKVAQAN